MKKSYLKSLTIFSILSTFLVCCTPKNTQNQTLRVTNNITNYDCWSTYTTSKVLQNIRADKTYDNLGAKIDISMMQDEIEGSQLIITPKGNETAYVTLDINDLTSDKGITIGKENINVYFQKYIKLPNTSNQNSNYKVNDLVPDMLLPMSQAIQYKENVVTGGYNQGLTIEIDSHGLSAGEYQGNFVLHIGNATTNIPVNVTIWPIKLDHKSEFQTSFLLYRSELINGEYDNSDEIVDAYCDEMLKYRINPYVIQNVDNNTVENFINTVKKYFDNKNYNSIILPYDFPTGYQSSEGSRAISYITELAKISTPEKPYLDYAYFYPGGFDEADLDIYYKSPMSENFFKPGGELDKTLENAILALSDYFKTIPNSWADHLKDTIRNIPTIFTNVNFKDNWVGNMHATFCPYISLYQDTRVTQKYQDAAKNMSNGNLWAYSCSGPVAPWATFHIDDDNINMRVNGWIDKKLNLTGYLYYEVDRYSKFAGNSYSEDVLVDLYNDPLRYENINGDGYLFYPGRKYGLNKPIASTRLQAFRDSMEDLDMLYVLDEKLNKLSEFYSVNDINLENYIGDLYDSLFNGSTPITDENNFYLKRKELANRIIELDNEDNLFVYQTNKNNKRYNNVFVRNKSLKINGKDVSNLLVKSGDGYVYSFETKTDNETYNFLAGINLYSRRILGALPLTDFASSINNVIASTETFKTIKKDGDNITATIISENQNRFKPYIGISSDQLKDYDELYFEYTNNDDVDIENLSFNLYKKGYGNMFICTNTCPAHETRQIRLNLHSLSNYELSIADEIRIIFDNEYMDSEGRMHLLDDRHITLSNIFAKKIWR